MSLLERAKALTEKTEFSLQSTQVRADTDTAARVRTMQRVFDPADLHEKGIETEPHVTVFYGLNGVSPEQVQAIVGRFQPFDVTFGRTSLFENEAFDVVKVDAESPQLRELHAQLSKLPNQNERAIYQPHLTLAYVKRGMGSKYLIDPLNGRSMRVRYVVFSDEERKKTVIPLGVKVDDEVDDEMETQKNAKCGDRLRGLTTKPGGKSPGTSIKNPRVYEALRKRGYSKQRAAAISNSLMPAKTKEEADKRAEAAEIVYTSRGMPPELLKAKALQQGVSTLDRARILNGNKTAASSFTVFKQADGTYRWVTRSSNAFRDRDGEIVSTKALSDDVSRADETGEYGPLRFWHMPGVDIGDADFNYMYKRTLIESGTFRDQAVAEKVARKAANYQISLGFRHPTDQPDENGVFHQIRRFERSLVPTGRAANPFTSLNVYKEKAMDDTIKQAALKALLDGDETQLKDILAGADSSEKTAESMGIAFKESGVDLNDLTPDQLLEFAVTQKEAQLNAAEKEAEGKTSKEDKPMDDPKKPSADDYAMKMAGMVEKMGGYMARMEKMFGKTEKTADDVTAVNGAVNAHSNRLATVEETVKSLSWQLETALKELNELKAEVPPGLTGTKPSEREDNIVGNQEANKSSNGWGALDKMVDFMVEVDPSKG